MSHSFEPNKRASDAWGHPIYIWADDGWRWGPVPYQRNGPGWHGSVDDAEDAAVEAAARHELAETITTARNLAVMRTPPSFEYLYRTHIVTREDVERELGHENANTRFLAWMRSNDWKLQRSAAGCNRWTHHRGGFIWLDDGVELAVALMIGVLRGDETIDPQHGIVTVSVNRPALDILAEIAEIHVPDSQGS